MRRETHTAHCPKAVRRCTATLPKVFAPVECGGLPQGFHGPLPQVNVGVYRSRSNSGCPKAVRQRNGGVPLPSGPTPWGNVPPKF